MSKYSVLKPIVRKPNEGRSYSMGRMSAVFKADINETDSKLSVSEWWLESNTAGPPLHSHIEDHMFYVLEGTLTVFVDDKWINAEKGSYIFIPGGYEHSFENRSSRKAGFMSINTPGGFESSMPSIVEYFDENPLGDAKN